MEVAAGRDEGRGGSGGDGIGRGNGDVRSERDGLYVRGPTEEALQLGDDGLAAAELATEGGLAGEISGGKGTV